MRLNSIHTFNESPSTDEGLIASSIAATHRQIRSNECPIIMSKQTVLITSATGRIGKELVARLATNDAFTVRACYFSDDKAAGLLKLGADEVVKFDLSDPATWHGRIGRR